VHFSPEIKCVSHVRKNCAKKRLRQMNTWTPLNFFEYTRLPVTREIDDIRQNFGIFSPRNGPRYSYQIFTTYDPWGRRITQSKFRPWPLTILRYWGKLFGGGGPGSHERSQIHCRRLDSIEFFCPRKRRNAVAVFIVTATTNCTVCH